MLQEEWEIAALKVDREDLLAVLQLRFGQVPEDIQKTISHIREPQVMQRLILVAANVPDWKVFLEELEVGDKAFRLVGEDFNPLSDTRLEKT